MKLLIIACHNGNMALFVSALMLVYDNNVDDDDDDPEHQKHRCQRVRFNVLIVIIPSPRNDQLSLR